MFSFTEENLRLIEAEKKKYPTVESAVMPVLWIAQQQNGNWLSEEAIQAVAGVLDLSPAHVIGVASFYTMYNKQPVGKYHLQVCSNISCSLNGAKKIIHHLEKKLNLTLGETTPDGLYTFSEVECLGSCGTAPAMQVNDEYIENLTTEKVDELLKELGK
ncbi:MAG: NADH-quinone oxidoreductase subunit NuoE [Bacteroidetes bacterium]|nr:NADH-quinone oxidoreductase subunit NuoE [Bacteroidota bacterium]